MPRYHHIVPRFYLAHFAELSMIQRVELQYGSSSKKSVRRVGGLDDFYSIPEEDDPDIYEKELFGTIENAAAPIFRRIIQESYWPLTPEDRSLIAEYLALQYLRGDDHRDSQSEMATGLIRLQTAAGGRDALREQIQAEGDDDGTVVGVEEIWDALVSPDGVKVEMTAAGHITQLGNLFSKILPYFAMRPWNLVVFSKKRLLTSDTPISLVPHPSAPPFMGVGLGNAYCILFPISRRVGLMLADPQEVLNTGRSAEMVLAGKSDFRKGGTTALAKLFNTNAIANSRMNIFHHPDDGDLVPAQLPQARRSTMVAEGLEELIAELAEQDGLASDLPDQE